MPPKNADQGSSRTYDATEHKMSVAELKAKLNTDLDEQNPKESNGLTNAEAKQRLLRDGPNAMTPPKKTPEIVKFLLQFTNAFMILLMMASALSFISYGLDTTQKVNLYCGIALVVIVFLQCTASYLEERKSNAVMDSLKSMMPAQCNVIREGQVRRVPASDLVVGDVVQLKGGDRVPADVKIIQTSGLKVESSSLTGEPDAFEMSVAATHAEPHESKNLCFNTSQCTEGSAVTVVIRTGDRTLIGMVASLATATSGHSSTLQQEISRVVKFITGLALFLAIVILIIGGAQKVKMVVVANLVITVFCANIPQGLPATVTSCLAIAAKRMHVRNVLVKNLEVIETLGSATCIASDKTGTLTQNKMSVQNFWFNNSYEMLGGGVIVGARTSAILTGGAATDALARRPSQGGTASTQDEVQKMFVRWKGNPLEPLLVIASVCNSAKFAASDDDKKGKASGEGLPELAYYTEKSGGANAATKVDEVPSVPGEHAAVSNGNPDYYDPADTVRSLSQFQKSAGMTGNAVTSRVEPAQPKMVEIIGDASESALLRYCNSIYPVSQIRKLYPKPYDVPFNSTNKYALCVVNPPGNEAPGKQYVFLKGAPEIVVERCDRWLSSGVEKPIDETFRARFLEAYERFANSGERVLGFARKVIDRLPDDQLNKDVVPTTGFVFLGIASLMDPPKVGVDQAVADCRTAGIRVFMVTGDHALTAEAIAHKVQIITKPTRNDLAHERGVPVDQVSPDDPAIKAVVITGAQLRELTFDQWEHLLDYEEIVFARTTPQQKLEIVEHLQRRGEIVAVTGDGVNDAPALKKANIGVAMGNPNASDVAREAADIIILDDDFCSIVSAIREGRLLFDNLKKSIAYTLTHLTPEMVPVFLNVILLMPLGLSSLLILTIDLGSELVPAISLAYEEPEAAIMQRRPRNIKTDKMVTGQLIFHAYAAAGVLESAAAILAYFCVYWSYGISLKDLVFPNSPDYFAPGAPEFYSNGNKFSADEQVHILSIGNGALYANIILCQIFHIWFCRTRATSVTQHALFSNRMTLCGMPWELMFIGVFCYIPPMETVFISGQGLPFQFWLLSLGFLAWVTIHTEVLKYFARRNMSGKKSWLGKIAW